LLRKAGGQTIKRRVRRMADDTKYGKYFVGEPNPREEAKGFGRLPQTVLWTDNDVIPGSLLFWAFKMGSSYVAPSHGPHTHKDPEVLVILGTNPDDPYDLAGAEIDICMGPEMEKHTITRSTLVYIPANFLHCPIYYRNVVNAKYPFIFIQSQYAPKLTEKSYKKLAKEAERDGMVFFDLDGTQTDAELHKQRAEREIKY
jgi:hypothetical protein